MALFTGDRPLFGPSAAGTTGIYEMYGPKDATAQATGGGDQGFLRSLMSRLFGGQESSLAQPTVGDMELQAQIAEFRRMYGRDPESMIELQIGGIQPGVADLMRGQQ